MDKISTLPWIDKYAGVVKIISQKNESNKTQFFPVSCQSTFTECNSSRYKDLIPDSSKKSVVYLEDKGIRPVGVNKWSATFDLVAWLNFDKIGFSGCSYAGVAIAGILSKLDINPFNSGVYTSIMMEVTGQAPVNQNPFQKYSYDEAVTQFMMYPFEYFVLSINVNFDITPTCISIPALGTEAECSTV